MCERCERADESIAHYRRLQEQIGDRQTREAAESLIKKLEAEKRSFHPPE